MYASVPCLHKSETMLYTILDKAILIKKFNNTHIHFYN